MKLLTKPQLKQLLKNRELQNKKMEDTDGEESIDFMPVVKFFDPMGAGTWLFTEAEYTEDKSDLILFGLCDLGVQCPELGDASLNEFLSIGKRRILGIERDIHFTPKYSLSKYTEEAMQKKRLVA